MDQGKQLRKRSVQIAVIAVQTARTRTDQLELEQAEALAASRDCTLVSTMPSRAERQALVLSRPFGPAALFRLWRWQSKHKELLLLATGYQSLRLARQIQKMHKKATIALYLPFALPDEIKYRDLAPVKKCFCGSSFIQQGIEGILAQAKPGQTTPELAVAQPGIDTGKWQPARNGDSRFVFGMAESPEPDSGALLVVRAMSALWQQADLPGWEVRMFGSGPRYDEIMAEAENLGVFSRLSLLSEQPLPEVCGLCSIWLAPGSSPNELPSTLWAGFAAHLPVIARPDPLHQERLFGRKATLAVNSANPQEMAKAMLELMRNPELRSQLRCQGENLLPLVSLGGMCERVWEALEVP